MQRDRQIQCGGGFFAQTSGDRGVQVPHRCGLVQLRFGRDLQFDAQRVQCRRASRRRRAGVRGGSWPTRPAPRRWPRRRRGRAAAAPSPANGRAGHPVAVTGHQQLRAGADQRGPRSTRRRPRSGRRDRRWPRGPSASSRCSDGARVQRAVGDQPQRAGQHHLVQAARRVAQPLQRGRDAGRGARRARAASRRSAPTGAARNGQSGSASRN